MDLCSLQWVLYASSNCSSITDSDARHLYRKKYVSQHSCFNYVHYLVLSVMETEDWDEIKLKKC